MNWKQMMIIRILLMVARMFAEDDKLSGEIRDLSNHITTRTPQA